MDYDKLPHTTRNKIILASRELFYEVGYEAYSVKDILERAGVSRGTFYHYFHSKDDVMANWVLLYDDEYRQWYEHADRSLDALELLKQYNLFILRQQERMDFALKKKMYSAQALSRGDSHFYATHRMFYKVSREIASAGQEAGLITQKFSAHEISSMFSIVQRGIIYDWCVANGAYSLEDSGSRTMDVFLEGLRARPSDT